MRIQISEKTRRALHALQFADGYQGATYKALIERAVLDYKARVLPATNTERADG